jgi:hypothetical protein
MSERPGAGVSVAATRTMRGSARVVLTCRMAAPDYDDQLTYSEIVDFDSDRCRLDGERRVGDETEARSVILDGPTTYTTEQDGRWTFTRGAAGTHGMLHPCGLLPAAEMTSRWPEPADRFRFVGARGAMARLLLGVAKADLSGPTATGT